MKCLKCGTDNTSDQKHFAQTEAVDLEVLSFSNRSLKGRGVSKKFLKNY